MPQPWKRVRKGAGAEALSGQISVHLDEGLESTYEICACECVQSSFFQDHGQLSGSEVAHHSLSASHPTKPGCKFKSSGGGGAGQGCPLDHGAVSPTPVTIDCRCAQRQLFAQNIYGRQIRAFPSILYKPVRRTGRCVHPIICFAVTSPCSQRLVVVNTIRLFPSNRPGEHTSNDTCITKKACYCIFSSPPPLSFSLSSAAAGRSPSAVCLFSDRSLRAGRV